MIEMFIPAKMTVYEDARHLYFKWALCAIWNYSQFFAMVYAIATVVKWAWS